MSNAMRVDISKSPITVGDIVTGKYQKNGTQSAMLVQMIQTTSFYPSAQHSNDMSDNPFTAADFGDSEKEYTSEEKRVCFIDVPTGTPAETILAKIGKKATLYKVLSNAPILTNNMIAAINRSLTTKDDIAVSQVAKYGTDDPKAGQLILDNQGRVQYRKVFLSVDGKEDIDRRGSENHPEYIPQALVAQVAAQKGITSNAMSPNVNFEIEAEQAID